MKLVDRLVLREMIGPFLFGVAAFASIFFAGRDLLRIISDVVKGLPVWAAGELLALHLPSIIVMVLPMAALLGVLLSFSRLSGDSEIAALYCGGVSLYRIVTAALALGFAVSALTFVLNEIVVPRANLRSREIRAQMLKEEMAIEKPVPLADIKDGVTNSIVYVQGGIDREARVLRDVSIVLFRGNRPRAFFFARRARWEGAYKWRLYEGYWQSLASGPGGLVVTQTFRVWKTDVRLRHTPEELETFSRKPDELSFSELLTHIRRLDARGAPTTEEELDLYNKISLPLAAFVFAVLASSLGLRSHRGGSSVGLGLSVLIIIVYWIIWHFTSAIAGQGAIHPLLGSFSASVLTLALGFALLVRAAR